MVYTHTSSFAIQVVVGEIDNTMGDAAAYCGNRGFESNQAVLGVPPVVQESARRRVSVVVMGEPLTTPRCRRSR